jgi:hypothetical protein
VDLGFDEKGESYLNVCLQSAVRVAVVERRSDPPVSGALDLVLNFAPACGISASTAADDEILQNGIAKIDKIFQSAGIEVGSVSYRDVPELADRVDVGGPSCLGGPETEAAFDAVGGSMAPTAVQLLFIESFRCEIDGADFGPQIAGVSNGLPGLPLATRDGVMVATNNMKKYPEDWALVMTHELAHFFGLFHTCENAEEICDRIPDTKEGDRADQNLMFPSVDLVAREVLTKQQGAVMRLSPAVRPDHE